MPAGKVNPGVVQFGKQPVTDKPAVVQYGKYPVAFDQDSEIGVVPKHAGGSKTPTRKRADKRADPHTD